VAERISTRSLIEKLGVKPGARASVLGVDDPGFLVDLQRAGADVSRRRRKGSDLVFLAIEDRPDLSGLAQMEPYLERNGAVWAVFPKGRTELREVDVIRAGVAAGLVDNKVVRFSDSHTALRFVIPVARR
jgi:NADPH-dependent 2,4-dienoyl-CoA reductase/sulfur reductase-like enzyme